MRAALDDPAPVQYHRAGRVTHGEQVVRDHDGGPPGHQPAQRFHDPAARLGVQAGGRFVQQQHRCVPDHRAGDRQALGLSAGQRPAPLAHHGVVALGEQPDERVGVGRAGGRDDVRLRRAGPAVGDVLPYGAVEDERLLQHDRDVLAQLGQLQLPQIGAVEEDRPLIRVVEAQLQLADRGLARAARPDQRQCRTGLHPERHVAQRPPRRVRIAERDAAELDIAPGAPDPPGTGGFHLDDLGALVEQFDDPLGRSGRRVERGRELGQVADRTVELAQQGDEDQQSAQRELPLRELPRPEAHHGQCAGQFDHLDDRAVDGTDPGRDHLRAEAAHALPGEPACLRPLPVVRLHQRDVAERLLGYRADRATAPAPLP